MEFHRNWFLASRPWSFTMTFISVSVASVLAAIDGAFSWPLYLLVLFCMILVHAATNLINDYYDVIHGVDSHMASTAMYRPHPLLEGSITHRQVLTVSFSLYGLCGAVALVLAWMRGWEIMAIALLGGLASLLYTAPPVKYKYRGLGELSVFLMWGPLMMEGSYFVQTRVLSLKVLLLSLPFGALVALVLLVNNLRDMEHDGERKIRTLPILIGRSWGVKLSIGLVVGVYMSVPAFAATGLLPLWSLFSLLSLPVGLRILKCLSREMPLNIDAQTAQLNMIFGLLLLASLIVENAL
jgi:1,4-dihydroxy-2-naphthoate octaprenyltransferase